MILKKLCVCSPPTYIPSASASAFTHAACGNGAREASTSVIETCDDGNQINNDGCNLACGVECGFTCTIVKGSADVCSSQCGDSHHASNEGCDDGNTNNDDGCSDACTIETGWVSPGDTCVQSRMSREDADRCITRDDCLCRTIDPLTVIGWPADECNNCVLLGDSDCESQGTYYADQGITYMVYIDGVSTVTAETVGVVKLKNSRSYDDNSDKLLTGVRFPHLSIRGFEKPGCFGCFREGRNGVADFSDNACVTCATDAMKIFFFQLTAEAIDGGEIAVHDTVNPLYVNFEFSIGGTLYVTKTTKPLASFILHEQEKREYDVPSATMPWPQKVEINEKRFSMSCSFDNPYTCPYEGDITTTLRTDSRISTTQATSLEYTTFTFKTIVNGKLYVRLEAFDVDICEGQGYTQTDSVRVVGEGINIRWDPINGVTASHITAWVLTDHMDELQITIQNDGYNCADANKFDIRFAIQTLPFTDDAQECLPGFSGTAGNCQECGTGTHKAAFGAGQCQACPSNRPVSLGGTRAAALCTACASVSNTIVNGARDGCECIAGFQKITTNAGCTACPDGFFKESPGDVQCTSCANNALTGRLASTNPDHCKCDAVSSWEAVPDETPLRCQQIQDVTQTVVLYQGLNHFSLWVDRTDTRITEILNTILNIRQATLSVFNARAAISFVTSTGEDGKFVSSTIMHTKDSVYFLNIQLKPNFSATELRVLGPAYRTLENIVLNVGQNWLPVVFDTNLNTESVTPIQTQCTVAPCKSFRYLEADEYQLMYREHSAAVVTANEIQIMATQSNTVSWRRQEKFNRGQILRLTLVSDTSRQSGKTGHVPVQLTDLMGTQIQTLRTNSYSTVVNVLGLRSVRATTTVADPTFCPTKLKEFSKDITSCECLIANANIDSIPWPRDECNKCVLVKEVGACDDMGQFMESGGMTFAIHARAPVGYAISGTSIAVAKLKRSFSPTGNPEGVKFEHLSIRAMYHPEHSGCRDGNTNDWNARGCVEADKLYVFTMSMAVLGSEITRDNAAQALQVNFEFDIGGVKFVTRSTESLNSVTENTNLRTSFNIYQTKTYELELQKFKIICPQNSSFVSFIPSFCPFEGDFPVSIDIDTTTGDAELKKFDPEASTRMPEINAQGIRIRGVWTGTVFVSARAQNLSYIIKRMPGIITFVTVQQAVFDQCEYAGVYKYFKPMNTGCDPDLIAAQKIGDMGKICITAPFESAQPRITQTDTLDITRISGDRQTRTVTTYNKRHQVSMPTLQTQYILSHDDEFLEINARIDANDCVFPHTTSTRIHISISDTPSIMKVDRLDALDSAAQKCVTSDNCVCKHQETSVPIGWPVDECNECVLDQTSDCGNMGDNFADQGITYFLHIDDTDIVRSNSIGVVKLKNSRSYDANSNSMQTGVRYPHLSVRDFAMPVCRGCYKVNRAGVANFSDHACRDCASDSLRIFFFQLTAAAINNVEIANNGAEDTLAVNFEFSIGDILYVTKTTKPLAQIFVNNNWIGIHNEPNTLQSAGAPVLWPQQLTIHPKLFGIVCSLGGIYTCPYEGDAKTALVILTAPATTQKNTSYSFRTIAGGSLYVRLDVFHVDLCSKEAVYSFGGNPNALPYYDIMYEPGGEPVIQTDQLKIVHYTEESNERDAYLWSPGNNIDAVGTTNWALTKEGDLLEIHIVNDGYYCGSSNQFEMRLSIQNKPFVSITEPCAAGFTGAPGSCVACALNMYKTEPGDSDCLPCAANSASDAARTACVCVAADGWQKSSAAVFACEQVKKIITQRFKVTTSLADFTNDVGLIRTKFKETLATVYATTVASISLEYYLENNPTVVQRERRRLLSLVGVDNVIVTANISSFQSITLPDDTSVQGALQNAGFIVSLLPKIVAPATTGADSPLLWIVVICGVFCVLGISVCIVVYVRGHRAQRDASQQIEANHQTISTSQAAYDTQTYMPPYYDPYSRCGLSSHVGTI